MRRVARCLFTVSAESAVADGQVDNAGTVQGKRGLRPTGDRVRLLRPEDGVFDATRDAVRARLRPSR